MAYRISVDIDGTFTDTIGRALAGWWHIGKALTTSDQIFGGTLAVVTFTGGIEDDSLAVDRAGTAALRKV